ncbi:hypothetical protein HDV00_006654 [Rhizophlyctis rosea]|nr:hypothetical protein HDV00_006654 [Rhizophlyctis rosea]
MLGGNGMRKARPRDFVEPLPPPPTNATPQQLLLHIDLMTQAFSTLTVRYQREFAGHVATKQKVEESDKSKQVGDKGLFLMSSRHWIEELARQFGRFMGPDRTHEGVIRTYERILAEQEPDHTEDHLPRSNDEKEKMRERRRKLRTDLSNAIDDVAAEWVFESANLFDEPLPTPEAAAPKIVALVAHIKQQHELFRELSNRQHNYDDEPSYLDDFQLSLPQNLLGAAAARVLGRNYRGNCIVSKASVTVCQKSEYVLLATYFHNVEKCNCCAIRRARRDSKRAERVADDARRMARKRAVEGRWEEIADGLGQLRLALNEFDRVGSHVEDGHIQGMNRLSWDITGIANWLVKEEEDMEEENRDKTSHILAEVRNFLEPLGDFLGTRDMERLPSLKAELSECLGVVVEVVYGQKNDCDDAGDVVVGEGAEGKESEGEGEGGRALRTRREKERGGRAKRNRREKEIGGREGRNRSEKMSAFLICAHVNMCLDKGIGLKAFATAISRITQRPPPPPPPPTPAGKPAPSAPSEPPHSTPKATPKPLTKPPTRSPTKHSTKPLTKPRTQAQSHPQTTIKPKASKEAIKDRREIAGDRRMGLKGSDGMDWRPKGKAEPLKDIREAARLRTEARDKELEDHQKKKAAATPLKHDTEDGAAFAMAGSMDNLAGSREDLNESRRRAERSAMITKIQEQLDIEYKVKAGAENMLKVSDLSRGGSSISREQVQVQLEVTNKKIATLTKQLEAVNSVGLLLKFQSPN